MEEIELKEYFHIIRKKLWMIVIITILLVVISGVVSYYILHPEYETFTTLMLSKPNTSIGSNEAIQYDDIILNQKLVPTYGEIAKSRAVTNEVINNLKLHLTPEEFGKKIDVSLIEDTEIIQIVVNNNNPELAARIANETAEVFKKNIFNMLNIENVRVIDKAEVPIKPIRPKPMLNMAVAGALGVVVSVFLVFLLEYMDNTIKTQSYVEKYLNLPVIGMIPKGLDENNPKSPMAEALRTLRTNLQFSNIDKNIKSIVVTSPGSDEGKSTIISNLAIIMAKVEKKILIIDADLRKPKIHKIFNTFNSHGLTNVLSEDLDYRDVVISTDINGLDILTSGPIPPNPSELLGSNKMEDFLARVKEDYDMVLLDSPPIGFVTDAAVLSAKCDGVILVCAVEQVIVSAAIKAKEQLDKVGANIIGVILLSIRFLD